MRVLPTIELLNAWEQGLTRPPLLRVLILLAAACPEMSLQSLAELSIGRRNAYLLALREQTIGSRLTCRSTCPACDEPLELNFEVSDIRATPEVEAPATLELNTGDYDIKFRLPNSLDLLALTEQSGEFSPRQQLLKRCLLAADCRGQGQAIDQLPEEVVAAIEAEMARADPQADVELALSCPTCTHQWTAAFDIISFFWEEINVWAYRTLYQVHQLASVYGWSEADILTMNPWKRQFYLKMVSR